MTAPRAVAFDLDGTLIDSRRDLATAVNRARADYGLAPLPLPAIIAMVGEGARRLVERATAELGSERVGEALATFFRHYGEELFATTRPYPGIPAALRTLAARLPLAVVTNKPEGFARRLLAGLGLDGYFRTVVGGDTLASRKPDPEGLREVARCLGVAVEEVLLVGDSAVDRATARAAGAPFAFVTWGFAPEERSRSLEEGDRVLESPADLPGLLGGESRDDNGG